MAKKKDQKIPVSQADEAQAQSMLGQVHQIAKALHSSRSQKEAEKALTAINSMPESAQMALTKALSRESHTDAADVLTAIYELSPEKNVRKEARRSLIQLEQARIYPQWQAPIDRTPILTLQDIQASSNPPLLLPEEEDIDTSFIDPDMEPGQVVTYFMDAWTEGEFDMAYNLLSTDSSLREGLSEEEWIERRDEWYNEADPVRFRPNFLHEREAQKSGIWLPNPFSRANLTPDNVVEVGWSIEIEDTTEPIPELPQATAIYKETGRHWYWTSYTLVQEEGGWRIQSMTDEGTNAQSLPGEELQRRLKEHDKRLEDITKQHKPTDADAQNYFLEILWRAMQMIYYDDALQKQSPSDRSVYLDAASRSILFEENERALVYLESVLQQFNEEQGEILRQIGAIQMQLSDYYLEEEEEYGDEEELAERFRELAEASVRESLNVENSATGHLLLADLLIEKGNDEDLDEAEDHLHQAQGLTTDQSELTLIENDLGEICMDRGEYEQALSHGRRILELDPDNLTVWFNIGKTYQALENSEEALAAFKRSIELHPQHLESYAALVEIYAVQDQLSEAREVLQGGLQANPDSAPLLTILASTYLDSDPDYAEEILEEAEEIDPDSEVVGLFRQVLNITKMEKKSQQKQLPRGKKRRKR